jgi:hypothetical protein
MLPLKKSQRLFSFLQKITAESRLPASPPNIPDEFSPREYE